ncbi:helix-turn-helix domain-containing protein [Streptomyces sp. NPDC055109]
MAAPERTRLKKAAYGHKTEHRWRVRAQVVFHAARGRSNARIAGETGPHLDTVRTWRGRFAERGLAGLSDRKRSGRPPSFTALQVAEVKALACQLLPRPARRYRAGHVRNWPARWSPGPSPGPSPPPLCGVGWPTTRSSPGSTHPGSSSGIPTSAPRLPA